MTRHAVMALDDVAPGALRAATVAGMSVVVARTPAGTVHVLRDLCPHMRARLSHGLLLERVVSPEPGRYALSDDEFVVRCPWHGYDFSVETGRCHADPRRARVRVYDAVVEDGTIYLDR
ncbi:MAG TPA: Rieske (2Fe-2S) protein [Baekduia sp.]